MIASVLGDPLVREVAGLAVAGLLTCVCVLIGRTDPASRLVEPLAAGLFGTVCVCAAVCTCPVVV